MRNLTLAVDDELLRQARSYAALHGTTVNQMVRDLLAARVCAASENSQMGESFRLADESAGKARAWKWNRDEIYADRAADL